MTSADYAALQARLADLTAKYEQYGQDMKQLRDKRYSINREIMGIKERLCHAIIEDGCEGGACEIGGPRHD